MERQRRYLAWLFAVAAATALMFAGIRGAQVGLDALRQLTLFKVAPFATDMGDTLVLAGIAVLAGTCAILIAPRRVTMVYRIVSDRHEKGIEVRDVQPGLPNIHFMWIDAQARAHGNQPVFHGYSARGKRPA
ncbi:MAG TPA: hypothetical protein VFS83_05500 [Ktedonobacterales bacterium]|nr:hypothetical protein [Ktedonobacterales bacterium]